MGTIFDIKEFAIHDGKGLRTTVFLKGCPLHCVWCHNPEGINPKPELMVRNNSCKHCGLCYKPCNHQECKPFKRCIHICPNNLVKIIGEEISSDELVRRLLKNKDILKNGGITFSGGEPLLQSDFLIEVIDKLEDIDITIETSGYVKEETFRKVLEKVNYVYLDIKLVQEKKHIEYTGVSNSIILNNLKILMDSGVPYTIRTPLIPGITDNKENLDEIKKLIGSSNHELLPYNEFSSIKYQMLNKEYKLNNI